MVGFPIFSVILISNLVVGSKIVPKEDGPCTCETWAVGKYCGSRVGTGHLSGGCLAQTLYQCDGQGKIAQTISNCNSCVLNNVGADQCNDDPESTACICNTWTVGKFCFFSRYLSGNCEKDFLFRCDGFGLEALKSAKCSNCFESGEGFGQCPGRNPTKSS